MTIKNILPGTRHEPNLDQFNATQLIVSLYENLLEGFMIDPHTFKPEAFQSSEALCSQIRHIKPGTGIQAKDLDPFCIGDELDEIWSKSIEWILGLDHRAGPFRVSSAVRPSAVIDSDV